MTKTALVTGSAGFIGFHICQRLLADGWSVVGVDALTDYYDVSLKEARHALLDAQRGFQSVIGRIENEGLVADLCGTHRPQVIVHLAAQAGVRFSLEAPRSYVQANLVGTLEVLEAARAYPPAHLMMASTSSAYGANTAMPYREVDKADHPMSFYAATKKANEAIAHSYAHLYGIPTTMFRFFTVYGPWGHPDMALFKFVRAILAGEPIDVYNHGNMQRDFTYVADLVEGLHRLCDKPPEVGLAQAHDTLSPVAPWRVMNIGHGAPEKLTSFIDAIEIALGKTAQRNLMPIQPGDVPATWAETDLLTELVGALPKTPMAEGVQAFVNWYLTYYAQDGAGR